MTTSKTPRSTGRRKALEATQEVGGAEASVGEEKPVAVAQGGAVPVAVAPLTPSVIIFLDPQGVPQALWGDLGVRRALFLMRALLPRLEQQVIAEEMAKVASEATAAPASAAPIDQQ